MNAMTRYEDTSRWEQRPKPVKTVPITPEQLVYLNGGRPPEQQRKEKYEGSAARVFKKGL